MDIEDLKTDDSRMLGDNYHRFGLTVREGLLPIVIIHLRIRSGTRWILVPLSCPQMSIYVLKCCTKAIKQTTLAGPQVKGLCYEMHPSFLEIKKVFKNLCLEGHIKKRPQPTKVLILN